MSQPETRELRDRERVLEEALVTVILYPDKVLPRVRDTAAQQQVHTQVGVRLGFAIVVGRGDEQRLRRQLAAHVGNDGIWPRFGVAVPRRLLQHGPRVWLEASLPIS